MKGVLELRGLWLLLGGQSLRMARGLYVAHHPTTTRGVAGINRRTFCTSTRKLATTEAPPPVSEEVVVESKAYVTEAVSKCLEARFGEEVEAMVTYATRPEYGDYQCNAAMGLAKRAKKAPRLVAEDLKEDLEGIFQGKIEIEVAGPGFLNLRVGDEMLSAAVKKAAGDDERAGVGRTLTPERVVVDYSSPNIAKEMHVGHLRSTVIGDCLANCLDFAGHDVKRVNHVGDWGTQFGMLLAYLEELGETEGSTAIEDLVAFYKQAKKRFDADPDFKAKARSRVVDLQAGERSAVDTWKKICDVSRVEFQQVYQRLGISTLLQEYGESSYNDMLPDVVAELRESNLAVDSEGAVVVFLGHQKETPLIIQKSDGGFNYATTDLAAAKYRTRQLNADRILYVTDSGQASHFNLVFELVKLADIVPPDARLEHVPFGVVQGEDGKKFKTRAGDTVRLADLLDEAVERALADLRRRSADDAAAAAAAAADDDDASVVSDDSEDDDQDLQARAQHIGIAAVKYADLKNNRESNYRFSFDKMLALAGNTAPYMLYSYARIAGIKRQCAEDGLFDDQNNQQLDDAATLLLEKDEDRNLARALVRFAPVLGDLQVDLRPNALCEYLYDLSQVFNRFYEACPVRKAETPQLAASRAALCAATANTLRVGLGLLGIPVLDRI